MKVLIATDGFDPALVATELFERIADPERVSVTVMSVTPTGLPTLERAALMLDRLDDRRAATVGLVDGLAGRLRDHGFVVRSRTAEGVPSTEILEAIETDWYDLTVLGSGHGSWLGQKLLGSVSTQLLHSSPSSLLIAHAIDRSDHVPRVLLAVDGSRGSEFATRSVMNLCDRRRVIVEVISVVDPPTYFSLPGAVAVANYPSETVHQRLIERAERDVEHAGDSLRRFGFDVTTSVLEGGVVDQILKRAGSLSADLVAVGSQGLGWWQRALLGSTSDQVVRHAPSALVGRRLSKEG